MPTHVLHMVGIGCLDCPTLGGCPKNLTAQLGTLDELERLLKLYPHMRITYFKRIKP